MCLRWCVCGLSLFLLQIPLDEAPVVDSVAGCVGLGDRCRPEASGGDHRPFQGSGGGSSTGRVEIVDPEDGGDAVLSTPSARPMQAISAGKGPT